MQPEREDFDDHPMAEANRNSSDDEAIADAMALAKASEENVSSVDAETPNMNKRGVDKPAQQHPRTGEKISSKKRKKLRVLEKVRESRQKRLSKRKEKRMAKKDALQRLKTDDVMVLDTKGQTSEK